jgi:hypothetical protein
VSVTRSFGIQGIISSTVSQPLFGTTLPANGTLTPDQFVGDPMRWTAPGTNPSLSYFQVVNSIGFRTDDRVAIATAAQFAVMGKAVRTGQKPQQIDAGFIRAITTGSPYDIITVQGLVIPHLSGEYFVLNESAANLYVERETSVGNLYFGNGSSVSPTDPSVFGTLQASATGPFIRNSGGQFSPYQTVEWWVYGTAGESFIASWDEF